MKLVCELVSYVLLQVFLSFTTRVYTYVLMLSSRGLSEKRGLCGWKIDC